MLNISKKLDVLEEAEQTGNIKITSRKQKLQKLQIMNWSVNKEKLIERGKLSRKEQTIHTGPVVLNQEIELEVLDWVYNQKNHGFFCFYT